MRLFLASAAADETTVAIRDALETSGHTMTGRDGLDQSDLAVVLLPEVPEPTAIVRTWDDVGAAQANHVPIVGVSLGEPSRLPPAAAAIPHRGEWVILTDQGDSAERLLAAIDAAGRPNGAAPKDVALAGRSTLLRHNLPSRVDRIRKGLRRRHQRESRGGEETVVRSVSVFVSYARSDKQAPRVCTELRARGFDVFVDKESIPGAADFRISIARGIRSADAFVLLLSPSVTRNPKYVRMELELAESYRKRIIPVRLRPTRTMPEGFDFVVSGLQYIDLYPDFSNGVDRLVTALRGDDDAEQQPRTARDRAHRMAQNVRGKFDEHQVMEKAKTVAPAMAAGALAAVAGMAELLSKQQARQAEVVRAAEEDALNTYVDKTTQLLRHALEEVHRATGMKPQEYREEFRPAYMFVLGGLSEVRPPRGDIKQRHDQLVADLRDLLTKFDSTARMAERGDEAAYARSVDRLNEQYAETLGSALEWLHDAAQASATSS